MLPPQRAWVQNLVRELRPYIPEVQPKKKQPKKLDPQAPSPPPRSGKYPTPLLPGRELYSPRKWTGKTPDLKTLVLPGKSHGQRSQVCCSLWGRKVRHNWATNTIARNKGEMWTPKLDVHPPGRRQQLPLSSVQSVTQSCLTLRPHGL